MPQSTRLENSRTGIPTKAMSNTESLIDSAIYQLRQAKTQAFNDARNLGVPANDRHPRNGDECISLVLGLNSDLNWTIGRCAVWWNVEERHSLEQFATAIGSSED